MHEISTGDLPNPLGFIIPRLKTNDLNTSCALLDKSDWVPGTSQRI